jgi:hypothetical protein
MMGMQWDPKWEPEKDSKKIDTKKLVGYKIVGDCKIPGDQEFGEFTVGTTAVRDGALSRDSSILEKCKPGEKELGSACYWCPSDYPKLSAGLCYTADGKGKCKDKDNYDYIGGLCYPKCTYKTKITLDNKEVTSYDSGATCSLPTYGRGAGTVPKYDCDVYGDDYKLYGFTCTRPSTAIRAKETCENGGVINSDGFCRAPAGCGVCEPPCVMEDAIRTCPSGYSLDSISKVLCWKGLASVVPTYSCSNNSKPVGLTCYVPPAGSSKCGGGCTPACSFFPTKKTCDAGYRNDGLGYCWKDVDTKPGHARPPDDSGKWDDKICNGLYYEKCKPGFTPSPLSCNMCIGPCPDNTYNSGAACTKKTLPGLSVMPDSRRKANLTGIGLGGPDLLTTQFLIPAESEIKKVCKYDELPPAELPNRILDGYCWQPSDPVNGKCEPNISMIDGKCWKQIKYLDL